MHVQSFRVQNFRRLKDVRVDLQDQTTIFVGANNSGKTSATHVFQLFLDPKTNFQIFDFTADCWKVFNAFDPVSGDPDSELPSIAFDLWFHVDEDNLHRVVDLLPSLAWKDEPVGVRMVFAPRDGGKLVENYLEARTAAEAAAGDGTSSYKPWPQSMTEYLEKKLVAEYEIKYYLLDAQRCTDDLVPEAGYKPFYFGNAASGAAGVVDRLIKVDFLDAQRHLSDLESHGRAEDLSKRLSRFYLRNLQKFESDLDALSAISDAESRLNGHFKDVFSPTLKSIGELGYPGMSNPDLVVKASFNAHSILSTNARVHYAMPDSSGTQATLPDQYNGLGFKNLIYMAIEILDFHSAWAETHEQRAPVHLIMIEEPEAHLHAQLQQVFIRKVFELLPPAEPGFTTQMVVTTHSSHILHESSFKPIRYFCRAKDVDGIHCSDVKNLSKFYDDEEAATLQFLQQYLKLTHCDLFFADAAVLVEGNVERLLLPLIIERSVPDLRACHLTILEVGGAFAHLFKKLIEFLELTTLIITDLDSVDPKKKATDSDQQDNDEIDDEKGAKGTACLSTVPGAETSNPTLRQWLPKLTSVDDLLAADDAQKVAINPATGSEMVRVAYQRRQVAAWGGATDPLAGRTLEEAFALQNLAWTQASEQKPLGLVISKAGEKDLAALHQAIFTRVRNLDKTRFALALMADPTGTWTTPTYIQEGLEWLLSQVQATAQPVTPATSEVTS